MAKGYLYDNGDELISREDVNEVPDSSSAHAGDVLELDSNKKPKWTTPESELPSTGSASAGDVLSLNSSKYPVWSTPSGGGGGMLKVAVDISGDPTTIEIDGYAYDAWACDKSISEIKMAFDNNIIPVLMMSPGGIFYMKQLYYGNGSYPGYVYEADFGITENVKEIVAENATGTVYYIVSK